MNERIKELAVESGIVYLSSVHPSMIEKFAELIIQECASIAKLTDSDHGTDYKSGRYWAGIDIQQHFGVE